MFDFKDDVEHPEQMIEFDAAGFRYGENDVLKDVTLTLEPGSMHFLTGRSGAGKTTFLRLIYLALRPVSGMVKIFGEDSAAIPRRAEPEIRRRMGVVLQDCDLIDHMTVLENIALPLRIAGRDAMPNDQLRELGAWVGLANRLDARPRELSSGERQRAAIARAVVTSPI